MIMKKLFLMLMAAMMLTTANAQNLTKQQEKAVKKEVSKKLKELKKGGYEIFGSSRTLEVALTKHYSQLEADEGNVTEVVGFSTAKSANLAAAAAQNSAANRYASTASMQVKGRVLSDMASDVTNAETEFDKFYATYEGKVQQAIRGELKHSFSVKHVEPDGRIAVQAFYLVPESAAASARIKALQQSVKETELAQKYAQKVSDFVNERVNPAE
jgi:Txe/YoeB family toxin of Txe-Axe toxin-antitoxin module